VEVNELIEKLKYNNIFLTGGAGVGKSYLTKKLIKEYFGNLVVIAPTGIAAVNIGGQTIHSFFEFSRNLSKLNNLSYPKKKLLQKTDLIIIDEISMVSKKLFDAINNRLNEVEYKGKLLRTSIGIPKMNKHLLSPSTYQRNYRSFRSSPISG
jgi:ATP-dependent DNA helicase PIF1